MYWAFLGTYLSKAIDLKELEKSNFIMVWVQIEYPEIEEGTKPRHRFMSSYEQVTCPDHDIVIHTPLGHDMAA